MDNAEHEPINNKEPLEQVAKKLAGRTAVTRVGELDLLASVGGIRGIAEAIVPALVFLISVYHHHRRVDFGTFRGRSGSTSQPNAPSTKTTADTSPRRSLRCCGVGRSGIASR